jgi:hypothetical protein
MPEIGATLREARMRQRLDISDVEAQTKIRAKYLRALENEEWDLLPGPTFVKSFLRTYADALGLDARLVMEEYKLRHERLADHELLPISPQTTRERSRRRGPPGIGRDVLVAILVVALVALLIVLGRNGGNDDASTSPNTVAGQDATSTTPKKSKPAKRPAAPAFARLRLVPSAEVWVCLQAAGNRTLIPGTVIGPSDHLPAYRSKRFVMTLGNGSVTLRVNGKAFDVPEVKNAIGYSIDRRGHRKVLPPTQRPTCA